MTETLNPEQLKAIKLINGPVLVYAGAGSGKTRVLTHRVVHLIQNGVAPEKIMAVTFTNKAAAEMKTRIKGLLGKTKSKLMPHISTYHSFCGMILREDIDRLGFSKNFVIFDQNDQLGIIKQVLGTLPAPKEGSEYKPKTVLSAISIEKSNLKTLAELKKRKDTFTKLVLVPVWEKYHTHLKQSQALDFDDMLVHTVELFQKFPDVLARWQERFKYILVDEFQDTNHAQYVITKMLGHKHRNVFIVGDTDQNIYSWRGASIQNLNQFEKDFRNAKVILLEQNYRSTQTILEVANKIISNNTRRRKKRLWTKNLKGESLIHYIAFDEHDEAGYVVDEIERLCRVENFKKADIAVIFRTHAQSRVIEDFLIRRSMKYHMVDSQRFYARKEVKDILSYLRVLYNPADNSSIQRVLNTPARGIGKVTENRIFEKSRNTGKPVFELLTNKRLLTEKIQKLTAPFVQVIQRLQNEYWDQEGKSKIPVWKLIERCIALSGYAAMLQSEGTDEALTRLENIMELMSIAKEDDESVSLGAFLNKMSLNTSDDEDSDSKGDAIALMTIHSTKGLEFPVVIMVGMEEGLLPHYQTQFDEELVEEERRLAYVGVTRAKQKVYFTSTNQRSIFGDTWYNETSRFIKEAPRQYIATFINERLLENNILRTRLKEDKVSFEVRSMQATPAPSKDKGEHKVVAVNVKKGDRVIHKIWGRASVSEVRGKGPDAIIKLKVGTEERTLLAKYAPLEVVRKR